MLFHKEKHDVVRLVGQAHENGVAFSVKAKWHEKVPAYIAKYEEGEVGDSVVTEARYGECVRCNIDIKIEEISQNIRKVALLIELVCIALSILALFLGQWFMFILKVICYTSLAGLLLADAITLNYFRFKKDESVIQFLKFNTALNRVKNAYYIEGRIPALSKLERYAPVSRESKYLSSPMLVVYVFILMSLIFNEALVVIVILISTALMMTLMKYHKGNTCIAQYMIYSKPNNMHYMAAISALSATVDAAMLEKESSNLQLNN